MSDLPSETTTTTTPSDGQVWDQTGAVMGSFDRSQVQHTRYFKKTLAPNRGRTRSTIAPPQRVHGLRRHNLHVNRNEKRRAHRAAGNSVAFGLLSSMSPICVASFSLKPKLRRPMTFFFVPYLGWFLGGLSYKVSSVNANPARKAHGTM